MKRRTGSILAGCVSLSAVAATVSQVGGTGTTGWSGIPIVASSARFMAAMMPFTTSSTAASEAAAPTLTAGGTTLSFSAMGSGYAVRIAGADIAPAVASQPVRVFVCTDAVCPADGSGSRTIDQQPIGDTVYASVVADATNSVLAKATVTSAGGTQFVVEDRYSVAGGAAPGAFRLLRRITAVTRQGTDHGFTSQFRMAFDTTPTGDYHFFSPAVWYDRNTDVVPDWWGGTKTKASIYWRETRAGLPLVMMQDPATGSALTIAHTGAPPTSLADETSANWLVSSDIRYGSLGVQNVARANGDRTSIGFIYPANETARDSSSTVSWVRRSNLITNNYYQEYTLLLAVRPGGSTNANRDINAAMADSWRLAYNAMRPANYRTVSAETAYESGIGLIYDWSRLRKNNAQGVPGVVSLPNGPTEQEIASDQWAYVMGYIGEQIPLGFQLYWRSFDIPSSDSRQALMRKRGAATMDFWANNAERASPGDGGASRTDTRLPFTWYNVAPANFRSVKLDAKKMSCNFPLYLRYLGDGMEAMVSAAVLARQKGDPHPNWERFTRDFGDWLVARQNTDGSFYRAYNPDGSQYTDASCEPLATVGDPKQNTTHIIRFLAQLGKATGTQAYIDAATKAGKFAIANTYGVSRYVGGTTDTPNILDREGGIIATRAALALYDATGESDWLKWARQAANFAETWTYAYNFAVKDAPAQQQSGAIGMSMISTGQSGADISASLLSYDLFRLYLFDTANDDHFRDMARLLESTTRYSTQLTGVSQQRFGYGHDGLLGEANGWFTLQGNNTGTGPAYQWLPWLTNADLDPLQRMKDRFGAMSIDGAMQQSLAMLETKNRSGLPGPFANWGR